MNLLTLTTHKQKEVVDITDGINKEIGKGDLTGGLCTLFLLHTTAAITTADLDPGTDLDFLDFLTSLIPNTPFRHPHDPAHAPDHILASIIGSSITIPFHDKALVLGTWQRVVLVELDGPQERHLAVATSPL